MQYRNKSAVLTLVFLLVWLSLAHAGWLKFSRQPLSCDGGLSTVSEQTAAGNPADNSPLLRPANSVLPARGDDVVKIELWTDEEILSRMKFIQISTARVKQTAAVIPEDQLSEPPAAEPAVITPQPTAVPTVAVTENTAPAATEFPGIDSRITSRWLFPLRVDTYTPAQGLFGASRGSSRAHAGIDLYAPHGTEVYAMTSGQVRSIYLFYENLLAFEVENDDGTMIRYTELEPLVKVGDRVEQGQLIARLRRNSSGSCMLHLEIYATSCQTPMTQTDNKSNYLYVSTSGRSFMRRSDLVDPTAVYSLPRQ